MTTLTVCVISAIAIFSTLIGYSSTRKEYKCYNLRLNKVVENINVTIDETGRLEAKEEENK